MSKSDLDIIWLRFLGASCRGQALNNPRVILNDLSRVILNEGEESSNKGEMFRFAQHNTIRCHPEVCPKDLIKRDHAFASCICIVFFVII